MVEEVPLDQLVGPEDEDFPDQEMALPEQLQQEQQEQIQQQLQHEIQSKQDDGQGALMEENQNFTDENEFFEALLA